MRRRSTAAWVVTGPIGHLYSAAADVIVLWARYGASRLRRRRRGSARRRCRAL